MMIKNTDWYNTEIRKSIENNLFDPNMVNLDNFEEIYDNFHLKDAEFNKAAELNETSNIKIENKSDEVRKYISQILDSKKD